MGIRIACRTSIPLIAAAFALTANAGESWHTSTIKKVYPQANGTFVLIFDTNSVDCPNTNLDKYHYVSPTQNGMTDEGAKKIYAAALLAMTLDLTVQVAFDNASTGCHVNRMIVVQ